jgi:hypothetical protein
MAHQETTLDFWSLKAVQLARECRSIANGEPGDVDPKLRSEAAQLAMEFQEALQLSQDEFEDQARRAALLAALRKRAIEILVKVNPDA